ncbi:MAG: Coenzyme F420 hydrogenase/dehydrogenase, beta subunit C-terminal domain [Megamonas funiformis]|uniref:Coenzyme F420 hydrogenase/dehydrogenase, beta subunit C-terminal domain n=1 Tax=Megamonas funiformis TaxID=437897 RepID=UPI002A806777|nr:Coenzyme F420 hydrogenase/dehydrogenase, beta subunit C-terminal domain [Megamonas funiformis]MDY3874176.1 Coenzyme F420 hydrogenase/dehydrogenase, beta subunit C-terminal domain [Megamonas funiformis]
MNLAVDKSKCCACTACKNICPKQAIEMFPDDKGFLYPKINENKCIKCGLCEKVCFYNTGYKTLDDHLNKIETYAIKHKDFNIRMSSRSGGIFTALSDYILDNNGVIYGVGYKENFIVCYKRTETKEERNEFRGSKYVQSELNDIFKQVKNDLENDRWVLFSGTPCHVAGLVKYLEKNKYEKLLLVDIICHGVPSPKIFNDYINYIENKYNGKINNFNFRDKTLGWDQSIESFEINQKKYLQRIYSCLFGSGLIFRETCYNCQFTNLNRPSDITIGDCWGIAENKPDIDDNNGVSLVIINTEKGKVIQDSVLSKLEYYIIDINDYLQPRLKKPNKRNKKVDTFWEDYLNNSFDYIVKKYATITILGRVKRKIKKIFFKIIR